MVRISTTLIRYTSSFSLSCIRFVFLADLMGSKGLECNVLIGDNLSVVKTLLVVVN